MTDIDMNVQETELFMWEDENLDATMCAYINYDGSEFNIEIYEMADFANAAGSVAATTKGGIPSMPDVGRVNECRNTTPLL